MQYDVTKAASTQGDIQFDDAVNEYDAILVLSFGGPEGMDDVLPFMENVLEGRNVPRERMIEVSEHYRMFDGISPINNQNRALIAALEANLKTDGPDLPIYFGNRNWHPFLTDTMRQMKADGVKKAIVFFTSIFSCYSGCRQYREDIMRSQLEVGGGAPAFDKIRMGYNHPLFIEATADRLREAFAKIPEERRASTHVVFTAHSVPMGMANNSDYVVQLEEASRLVAEAIDHSDWNLVYQSRSGPPHVPWLEPDICDYLTEIHAQGVQDVIVLPIGFISDHMEVIYDLDTEALQVAQELGLNYIRAGSVGTHPAFVQMLRDLVVERMTANPERLAIGERPANHDICPVNCCLPR